MGILFALFFGAAVVFVFALAVVLTLVELLSNLANTVFGFVIRVGIVSLQLIIGVVAAIIIWKMLKRGWKEFQEIRKYLKKNKEIENRMKQQAMRK